MTQLINPKANNFIALDVGERRIGVAIASADARIAQPLRVIDMDKFAVGHIKELCDTYQAGTLVVGLPRGLEGQETAQTAYVRDFVQLLQAGVPGGLTLVLQDEAATSVQAREQLEARGKPYTKGDIDAYAAAIILGDYLVGNNMVR